jgi:multidrug resistance efflux pump
VEEAQLKVDAAQAKMSALQSDIEALDRNQSASKAPFDGVILKRYKNETAFLNVGEIVYQLCDLEKVWIESVIPEKNLSSISLGTSARVYFTAYPGQEFLGQVSYIGPATRNKMDPHIDAEKEVVIPIRISLEKKEKLFKPGLSARVALQIY